MDIHNVLYSVFSVLYTQVQARIYRCKKTMFLTQLYHRGNLWGFCFLIHNVSKHTEHTSAYKECHQYHQNSSRFPLLETFEIKQDMNFLPFSPVSTHLNISILAIFFISLGVVNYASLQWKCSYKDNVGQKFIASIIDMHFFSRQLFVAISCEKETKLQDDLHRNTHLPNCM